VSTFGLIGAGVTYMGSSWPVVGKLKRDKPDLMNNMFIGMAVLQIGHNHNRLTLGALRSDGAHFLDWTLFHFHWVEKFAPVTLCHV